MRKRTTYRVPLMHDALCAHRHRTHAHAGRARAAGAPAWQAARRERRDTPHTCTCHTHRGNKEGGADARRRALRQTCRSLTGRARGQSRVTGMLCRIARQARCKDLRYQGGGKSWKGGNQVERGIGRLMWASLKKNGNEQRNQSNEASGASSGETCLTKFNDGDGPVGWKLEREIRVMDEAAG
eukprot:scaffold9373_cov107-Isochrysis_galbana.AAC.3